MRIKLSKEQASLLDAGTIVVTASGNTYRYLPFWYKDTEEEGVYECYTFGGLPDELVEFIKDERNPKPNASSSNQ